MPFVLRQPGESVIAPHATQPITEWVPGRFRKNPPNGFLKWPRLRVRILCGLILVAAIIVAARGADRGSSARTGPGPAPNGSPPSLATTYVSP